ncbi:MAG: ABC transporter permease [Oscillospiraceae bacterium]
MLNTTIKRVIQGIFILFCVTLLSFVLLRNIPGDPTKIMAPNATDEQREVIRAEMGLDNPILVQFKDYIVNIFHGDMGQSYFKGASVNSIIAGTIGKSALLMLNTVVIAVVLSMVLGVTAALHNGKPLDRIISGFSVIFQSMPNYWVATMLILLVCVKLNLLPSMDYKGYISTILPSIVLALPIMSVMTKNIRLSMIDSYSQDFVKAAHARGVPKAAVLFKYALRNSLIPLLTVFGGQLGFLAGSIVVIEYVFSYPGIGYEILNAINRRDYNLVQGLIIVFSTFFIVVNMLIDIGYAYLDPRIRKAQGDL